MRAVAALRNLLLLPGTALHNPAGIGAAWSCERREFNRRYRNAPWNLLVRWWGENSLGEAREAVAAG
jgi:hypothetical protein